MNAKITDKLATTIFYVIILAATALLAFLLGYILFKGLGVVNWHFLTAPAKTLSAGGGIGTQLFNSIIMLVVSMIFTVPLGLGGGIYLAEYAKPNFFTNAIRLCVETLASLPSIVVGLFGLLVFVNMTGWGYTLLGGALSLTVLNLPVMTRVCEDSIRTVKQELLEASLALGATKWQTITKVVLPVALPGILTGIILTAGRVFGEAAAIMYTAGMSSPNLNFKAWSFTNPRSPINLMRPAETLAVHIWKVNSESLLPDARQIADGSSAVLILAVLIFNILARFIGSLLHKRLSGEK